MIPHLKGLSTGSNGRTGSWETAVDGCPGESGSLPQMSRLLVSGWVSAPAGVWKAGKEGLRVLLKGSIVLPLNGHDLPQPQVTGNAGTGCLPSRAAYSWIKANTGRLLRKRPVNTEPELCVQSALRALPVSVRESGRGGWNRQCVI